MAKRQLRSELTSPSAASSKRPRANQYHDTSIARPKARRTDSCGPHISDFVPPNTSAELAIVRVTTKTAQAPANDTNNVAIRSVPKDYDPSAPGSYTGPSSGETLAVTPMPMNGTQPTPGPHMVSSTAENNSVTSRPFLTDGISTTTRPYVTHHDTTTVVRADQTTTSNTQPISQALSHHTTTSERQNLTITHEDDGSATRNVKKRTEGRGSNTSRSTHTESSKSFDQNLQRSAPTPLTNPSIDRLRWMPTPFTLIELSHGEQWLPRVQVSPDSELSKILDIGQHPVASAIAKIHRYGHSNSIPQETRQVLRMFDDIARSDYNEPHITFLDPLLYSSLAYTRAQCEDFRKKEWAWLVRAGRPITFPGEPSESWDLVTIQPIYESLEICLVVSRDNRQEIYTVDCSRPPPPGLESIQVSSRLHIRNKVPS